jgi:hypothetical protein
MSRENFCVIFRNLKTDLGPKVRGVKERMSLKLSAYGVATVSIRPGRIQVHGCLFNDAGVSRSVEIMVPRYTHHRYQLLVRRAFFEVQSGSITGN